jgi:hypothetical protein
MCRKNHVWEYAFHPEEELEKMELAGTITESNRGDNQSRLEKA